MGDVSSSKQTEAGQAKASAPPELYDFRRPMTLPREHSRALEVSFETYARQFSMQLASRLRIVTSLQLDGVDMVTYDDYIGRLDQHTVMALVAFGDQRPNAILEVNSDAVMLWIDYLLGGPGLDPVGGDRELTEIEHNLVMSLLRNTMADLKYAFASIHEFSPSVRSIYYSPQFVQAVPAQEAVIVARFTMNLEGRVYPMTIMVPAETLVSPLQQGDGAETRTAGKDEESQQVRGRLQRSMADVPMELAVRFQPTTVNPAQVYALQVGQTLPLKHPISRPLQIVVDDLVLAHAVPGNAGTQLACKVVADGNGHGR